MAFTVQGVPFKIGASEAGIGLGGFDLGEAIKSGLNNANLYHEVRSKPGELERKAMAENLANKIQEAKAKYAMDRELANLQNTQAGTGNMGAMTQLHREQLKALQRNSGLFPLQKKIQEAKLQAVQDKLNQQNDLRNLLFGNGKTSMNGNQNPPKINENSPKNYYEALTSGLQNTPELSGSGVYREEPPVNTLVNNKLPFDIDRNDLMRKLMYQAYGVTAPSSRSMVLTGPAREAESMKLLEDKYGPNSYVVKQAKALQEMEKNQFENLSNRRNAITNAMAFKSLPVDEKQRVIATAVGMGLDPIEASTSLNNGKSLNEMAREKNIDLKDIQPVYPLSGESRKKLSQRNAFVQEINSLEKNINEGTQGFGRRVAGFSPEQVISAIKDEDPDKQGKFLAANALQSELMTIRLNSMNGRVGIEAIKHMTNAAHANAKVFESLISDKTRSRMNHYMSKWINEAVKAYSTSEQEGASLGKGAQYKSNNQKPSKTSLHKVFTAKNGKQYIESNGEWREYHGNR